MCVRSSVCLHPFVEFASPTMMLCFSAHSPLNRLEVVQEGTETTAALKHHGPEAPVVHGNSVRLILKEFGRLQGGHRSSTTTAVPVLSTRCD